MGNIGKLKQTIIKYAYKLIVLTSDLDSPRREDQHSLNISFWGPLGDGFMTDLRFGPILNLFDIYLELFEMYF